MAPLTEQAIDTHVGERIRERRTALRITQDSLAQTIGVSFQQVQKYETGRNRVSASRLYQIAQVLKVPIAFFWEGLGDTAGEDRMAVKSAPEAALLNAFRACPEGVRGHLLDIAEYCAKP